MYNRVVMVLFKINGERNSGTNFLEQILRKNKFPTYVQKIRGNVVYHWKHGVPSPDHKKLDEKVVDLFIFRDLDDWLVSFWKTPYHLNKVNNFNDFLISQQKTDRLKKCDYRRTNEYLNKDDEDKTIFQIREYKFKKIMEYKENNKDVILLNLSFIQDEKNLSQFLKFLADKYIPELRQDNYICNINHTKNKKANIKNRTYNIDINQYRDIIDSNKNEEIENFIDNLTFISK